MIDKVFGRDNGGTSRGRGDGEGDDTAQDGIDAEEKHEVAETKRLVAAADATMDRIWKEEASVADDYSRREFGLPLRQDIMEQVKNELHERVGMELEGDEEDEN